MGKPRIPLDVRIKAHLQTYRASPAALVTALNSLLEEEMEQRIRDSEKMLAKQRCKGAHPAGSDRVGCLECGKVGAYMEVPNDEGQRDEP